MFNAAWEWVTPIILLLVYGGFMLRDAWNDRTPRAPQMEWWRNRPVLAWWAEKTTKRERAQTQVDLPQR